MRAYSAVYNTSRPDSTPDPRRTFNSLSGPFVETGYRGYVVRGVARYQSAGTYTPALEISLYWRGAKLVICEHEFPEEFIDPSEALDNAIQAGRQAIDEHVEHSISVLEVEFQNNDIPKPKTCVQTSYSPRLRYGQNFPGH
jgi:hypothetical protein